MSGAQEYYDSLLAQGYTSEQAIGFTQQHFPGFSPAAAMPAPMPAAPQPMAAPIAAAPQMGMPMGEVMPAPTGDTMAMQPSSGSNPIGYIAVVCMVITLALSTWSVLGGTWIAIDDDDSSNDEETYMELNNIVILLPPDGVFGPGDYDGTCEDFLEDLDDGQFRYDSKSEYEEAIGAEVSCDGDNVMIVSSLSDICDESEDDEICDAASAGLTGTIILWVAIGVGLIAILLISFNVFNIQAIPVNTQMFGMIAGISSGVLATAAVVVWMIMLPELDDSNYGLNVWLTFGSAATGIVGGVLVKTHGNPSA